MILRILFLICGIFAAPSLGRLDMTTFTEKFGDMCFQNNIQEKFKVNGQDKPLSNTLENFISLAEKFEAANPSLTLKDELEYFISGYIFENVQFTNGEPDVWSLTGHFELIDKFWDPDVNGYKPTYNDPFSDDEKCSLLHMISHSILNQDTSLQSARSYSSGNLSSEFSRTQGIDASKYFPQEMGVVAIKGTKAAVSLSKVLIGLFVGMKDGRNKDIATDDAFEQIRKNIENLPQDKNVDILYAVTLADVLMKAKHSSSLRQGLAPNGKWASIPIDTDKNIDGFCPMVYLLEKNDKLPAYSYSSVRGAADGLILGLASPYIVSKKSNTKLSQILRMYYSPDGISLDPQVRIEEYTDINHLSFCKRQDLIQPLESKLAHQMLLYGYITSVNLKKVDSVYNDAKKLYDAEKENIFRISSDAELSELQRYCNRPTALDKPENLPRETYLDVIIVMDSNKDNPESAFQDQQMIVGYLATYLDLRYTGSKMTILLDHKASSGTGSSSKIELESVVFDTYSSSCAACMAGQIEYKSSNVERDEIIVALDQFLQERKENETKLYNTNGKVVIYFNYQSEGRSNNNKIQGNLEKALRDLHLHHQDVVFYAVGLDSELLKKYTKNDPSLTFFGNDGQPKKVADDILKKISDAPALMQYHECKDERTDKTVSFESLVSPHTIQHYEMPAEFFYKSLKLSFKFESQYGNIRVCHNRATEKPENEIRNCKNTTGNTFAEFKMSNPCKGFSKETCSPFYFSVMGMNSNEGEMRVDNNRPLHYCNDLNDKWCATLDQFRFKVSHTGVRCSGCLRLGAPQAVILFTLLMTYFMYKRL